MALTRSNTQMDIIDLIKDEHRNVDTLFSVIETTDDIQKLYDYFNKLYEQINLHAGVREQIFYPVIREYEDTNELVAQAQKQQNTIKELLEEIESFSPTSAEFKQKINQLKEVMQHQAEEEENQILLQVRNYMNATEREQLGKEFTSFKSKLQNEI